VLRRRLSLLSLPQWLKRGPQLSRENLRLFPRIKAVGTIECLVDDVGIHGTFPDFICPN
jgi:hypothetical protein